MRAVIRDYILTKVQLDQLEDNTCLFSSGLIDSFGVLEMISFLEDSFGVEIDTQKHELLNFDTINDIETLVLKLRTATNV